MTTVVVAPAGLAALAGYWAVPGGASLGRLERLRRMRADPANRLLALDRIAALPGGRALAMAVACTGLSYGIGDWLGAVVAVIALAFLRTRAVGAQARVVARRRSCVVAATTGLMDELRAGQPPRQALAAVASAAGELAGPLATVAAEAKLGADVPFLLNGLAELAGAEGLRAVAGCWAATESSGASLADALEGVIGALEGRIRASAEAHAQLSGARASMGLLTLLPLAGIALGTAVGAAPAHLLLHTGTGHILLVGGGLLDFAGWRWGTLVARAAERA